MLLGTGHGKQGERKALQNHLRENANLLSSVEQRNESKDGIKLERNGPAYASW